MDHSVAVVTGATSGIGRFIALGLAQAGHHVVLVGRDQARGEAVQALIASEAPRGSSEFLPADLSGLAATRALGEDLLARHGRIAVLVNNAGTFLTRREVTAEGHERVLATNHLSPWVLTRALLPALRAAGAARVVNVGSSASDHARINPDDLELRRGWGLVRAYSRSKLALMTSSFALAERLVGQRRHGERGASRAGGDRAGARGRRGGAGVAGDGAVPADGAAGGGDAAARGAGAGAGGHHRPVLQALRARRRPTAGRATRALAARVEAATERLAG